MRQILKNQSGMASIMFAIFMAIVLCLLATGFAVLVRNDQRQTLDKTLSNQATYAAESAINYIQDLYHNASPPGDNNTCTSVDLASPFKVINKGISDALTASGSVGDITITCLTWSSNLSYLYYQKIDSQPVVVPIVPASGRVQSITIQWSPEPGNLNTGTTSDLTQLTLGSSNLPTLRIAAASNSDISGTKVIFINPSTVNSASFDSTSGNIGNGKCNSMPCKVTLYNLPGELWNSGLLSITSLNGSSINVKITANNGAVNLIDAQAQVDATAKSQDVIKRLVANISLTPTTWQPDFAASADYLCKNYALNGSNNTYLYTGMVYTDSGHLCPDDSSP
jgi:Tfp pilus assembly protein PilX